MIRTINLQDDGELVVETVKSTEDALLRVSILARHSGRPLLKLKLTASERSDLMAALQQSCEERP
jgi:hypothetical protein